ncbi:MAG: AMP-binding protein [Pseudomonadota bacterium]|nr:AMP-binding protein [Pseudomonadota bacterium]
MRAEPLLRTVLTTLFRLCFRVEVRGLEHYHAAGRRVLILANHQSYLDPPLLGTFLPEKPAYAINVFQADKWYFRWLDRLVTLYRLDPSKALSMKRLIHDLRQGAKVVLFPEGRITTSGGIMKMYEGTSLLIEKTGATVLPVRIDGAEYSKVSRLGRKLKPRWFPKVRITFLPPVRFPEGQKVPTRAIYDLMTKAAFDATDCRRSLLGAVLEAARWHGGKHIIAEDITRVPMNYRQLFTRAFILSSKLSSLNGAQRQIKPENDAFIGIMLPSGLAALVSFVSLHLLDRIPCMLNFSAGTANILHACRIATVKTVITSRLFVEKAKLEPVIMALREECEIVWLEDIRAQIGLIDKLRGLWRALFVREELQGLLARTKPDDPAVILYTSGSEGTPKGVALSHANILANIAQARSRLDLMPADILFNALPVFHSFGLTVGMLLPLVAGVKTFLYPSPLHYRIIPDLMYDTDATIMLGTDTFYNGYAHYAHEYDFWNIRLAVAGAEKLRESTRRLYCDRFGVSIMEGYGVTETSPVISCNTPMEHKPGTVGRAFPAIECRLEKVEGLPHGGRLFVKGPNVMLGYLKADQPGIIQRQGEWYDTGDIVDIDAEDFISIQGRAKRFAKIGGEMVSLLAVEELAFDALPDICHAAVAAPDERKGEHIILFTESPDLTRDRLVHRARAKGLSDLCLPRHVIFMESIPRLGNGKIDYVQLASRVSAE